jgi:hypothetical protein
MKGCGGGGGAIALLASFAFNARWFPCGGLVFAVWAFRA